MRTFRFVLSIGIRPLSCPSASVEAAADVQPGGDGDGKQQDGASDGLAEAAARAQRQNAFAGTDRQRQSLEDADEEEGRSKEMAEQLWS